MKKLLSVILVLAMLMTFFVPFASAQELDNNIPSSSLTEEIYANGKVWFDLKGNSRLFVPSTDEAITNRGTYENYLPGVDFAGFVEKPTGVFADDQEAVKMPSYGGAMFVYNAGGSTSYINLTTDEAGNYYWTVNDEKYLVRPQENVLKFVNKTVSTSSILTDSEKTSRYQSLNGEKTIDVPDGKYSSIGFLGGAKLKYSKQIKVTLVYGDEEIEYGNITHKYGKTSVSGTDGTMYMRNFTDSSNSMNDAAHDFQVQTIPTEPKKVLTAIKVYDVGLNGSGNSGNQTYPYYIISAWGEEQSLTDKITALETLNETGITDAEGYETVKFSVEDIDAYLVNYNTALTDEQKAVYDTAKANLTAYEAALAQEKLYAANTEWFDLNGNAKLFMEKDSADYTNRANLIDYLPGVDYAGYLATPTGEFASDKGSVTNPSLSIFTYTIDNSTDANSLSTTLSTPADFKTGDDGNLYFVYNDTSYRVDPTKNVIKSINQAITTTKITNTEDVARYESLKTGVTMDVPDGYYKSIGFLTAVYRAYSKAFKVELFYEGEETPVLADDFYRQTPPKTDSGAWKSDIYFHTLTGVGSQASGHYLTPWTITIDSSKKLDKIRVYDCGATPKPDGSGTNGNNPTFPIYFISSWGDEVTLAERFTALDALNKAGNVSAIKAAVAEIDAILAAASTTTGALKAEDKVIYDTAKALANALNITSVSYENSKVTVSYETGIDTDAKLIVAEYDDAEETIFKKVTVLPVTFGADKTSYEAAHTATGTKVKVFVWKDLINFFPYK